VPPFAYAADQRTSPRTAAPSHSSPAADGALVKPRPEQPRASQFITPAIVDRDSGDRRHSALERCPGWLAQRDFQKTQSGRTSFSPSLGTLARIGKTFRKAGRGRPLAASAAASGTITTSANGPQKKKALFFPPGGGARGGGMGRGKIVRTKTRLLGLLLHTPLSRADTQSQRSPLVARWGSRWTRSCLTAKARKLLA